jgi:uncharacterized OsmC-like protein
VARFAPLYNAPIEDAAADVRATFRNTEKYDIDDAPPYFDQVTIELTIQSEAPAEQVRRLVAHAERACHAAQTLRRGVPVKLDAQLNGESLSEA